MAGEVNRWSRNNRLAAEGHDPLVRGVAAIKILLRRGIVEGEGILVANREAADLLVQRRRLEGRIDAVEVTSRGTSVGRAAPQRQRGGAARIPVLGGRSDGGVRRGEAVGVAKDERVARRVAGIGPRHRPAVRRRARGAGALAACRARKRLIELTGAKVVFEAAVRDQVAGERGRGEGGRNSGSAQSKSMIQGKSLLWKMRQARRIATWLTTRIQRPVTT